MYVYDVTCIQVATLFIWPEKSASKNRRKENNEL